MRIVLRYYGTSTIPTADITVDWPWPAVPRVGDFLVDDRIDLGETTHVFAVEWHVQRENQNPTPIIHLEPRRSD